MFITKSPSGAMSPYYSKGGYSHGTQIRAIFILMALILPIICSPQIARAAEVGEFYYGNWAAMVQPADGSAMVNLYEKPAQSSTVLGQYV